MPSAETKSSRPTARTVRPRLRPARLLALVLLTATVTAGAVSSAEARIPIRVGIGDQSTAMFDQPAFKRAKFKRVRYFIRWNAMDDDYQRLTARAYVLKAKKEHISVLLHLSTDNFAIKEGHLPSRSEYKTKVRRLVKYFRHLGVREFGVWNEANHASQPTYDNPKRAAEFFVEMYRAVKGHCHSCGVVALDVLDQRGVDKYVSSFFRALSPTYRKRATVVGIHNYGDVNRKRKNPYTATMIRTAHRYNSKTRFWMTETGGLVKFGSSFPCSESRAADRLGEMFSIAKKYRRSGIERIFVYNWTGAGCDARFDAGLTNPDGSTRKGYDVLRKHLSNYLR